MLRLLLRSAPPRLRRASPAASSAGPPPPGTFIDPVRLRVPPAAAGPALSVLRRREPQHACRLTPTHTAGGGSRAALMNFSVGAQRGAAREGGGEDAMFPPPASAVAVASARPGVAYSLGRTLYLSLTNRTNARPIVDTRGPSFRMPIESGFVRLPEGVQHEPTPAELAAVVEACYDVREDIVGMGENDPGVVFGGAGEPLLRLDALRETVDEVRTRRHGVPFRVSTNGLFPASTAAALAELDVAVTVALQTADPAQYDALMRPAPDVAEGSVPPPWSDGNVGARHAAVCAFVVSCVEAGVRVECTAVAAPGVDLTATRRLAEALGAVAFRTRDYFA